MAKVQVNINDMIRFRLTEYGRSVREAWWKEYGLQAPVLTPDSNGRVEMQLWEVMQIFGPAMRMGGKQIIVDNEIEL